MITQGGYTIFEALGACGIFFGFLIGGSYGVNIFGLPGGIIGCFIGGGIGFLTWNLLYKFTSHSIHRSLEMESSQRLRERIRSGNEYYIIHLLLAHLMQREEDIANELPAVVDLMKSESRDRRRFGWVALKFAFPEYASKIAEYRPNDSVEKCRSLVNGLGHGI